MYVCSCFGITEQQVREHAERGACTPRQVASACKAGTDCGSCVRRIQSLLGRGACPRRELIDNGAPDALGAEPEPLGSAPDAPRAESGPPRQAPDVLLAASAPPAAAAGAPVPGDLRAVA
ncbi:(2Fe-2S)-binding protein [Streptomyces sp. GS7]|uniref:(2Fe-2S)-binding protein n=1 Tax=Streptomyces sp. GS7 TaxID=2692234 RepID=UPI001317E67A|nr:(2Fe-2S)-binding protein [Streptomyces sp. GS7]QHC21614.1 (2Fe-2S)-binding protein [Streptomyces sp. GS7]